ncbi:MAG TPA: hypothetical protein VGG64_15980 [Pirellulales bacterium]
MGRLSMFVFAIVITLAVADVSEARCGRRRCRSARHCASSACGTSGYNGNSCCQSQNGNDGMAPQNDQEVPPAPTNPNQPAPRSANNSNPAPAPQPGT